MEVRPIEVVRGAATVPARTLQKAEYLLQNVPQSLKAEAQSIRDQLQVTKSWGAISRCEDRLVALAAEAKVDLDPDVYRSVEIPDVYLRVDSLHSSQTRGNVNVRLETLVKELPAFQTTLVKVSQAELDAFVQRFDDLSPDQRNELGQALEEQSSKTKEGRQLRMALLVLLGASLPAGGALLGIAGALTGLLIGLVIGIFYGGAPAEYDAKPTDPLKTLANPEVPTC